MAVARTLADLRGMVRERIGNVSTNEISDGTIDGYIQSSYERVWLMSSRPETYALKRVTLSAGTHSFSLDDDLYGHVISLTGANGIALRVCDAPTMLQYQQLTPDTGTPLYFAILRGMDGAVTVEVWPTPSTDTTLLLRVKTAPGLPTADTDILGLPPYYDEVIVGLATAACDRHLREFETARSRFAEATQLFQEFEKQRQIEQATNNFPSWDIQVVF